MFSNRYGQLNCFILEGVWGGRVEFIFFIFFIILEYENIDVLMYVFIVWIM